VIGDVAVPVINHYYCGHAAGWIKMPLGTEVGLSLGDIVLDGESAPRFLKGHNPPIFGQRLLWPNGGWTKMLLGMEVGLGPDEFVFDVDAALHEEKGHSPHPIFGPCPFRSLSGLRKIGGFEILNALLVLR